MAERCRVSAEQAVDASALGDGRSIYVFESYVELSYTLSSRQVYTDLHGSRNSRDGSRTTRGKDQRYPAVAEAQ